MNLTDELFNDVESLIYYMSNSLKHYYDTVTGHTVNQWDLL